MCGFVYSTDRSVYYINLDDVSARGPDSSNILINQLGYFYHARLATRDTNVHQPARNMHGVLLYNGTEYGLESNDVDYILSGLSNNIDSNVEFLKTLNGDFSICWVTDKHITLAKDCFGTKPLFFGIKDNVFIAASDEYAIKSVSINPIRLEQNTILVFDRNNLELQSKSSIIDWDLTQGTKTLTDVFETFESSVLQRHSENCLVKLSSGYDSGVIAACLNKYNKTYSIASYIGTENKEIMKQRFNLHKGNKTIYSHEAFSKQKEHRLKLNASQLLNQSCSMADVSLMDATYANKNNIRVIITGTGGDELYSDYGFNGLRIRYTSLFGGVFTKDLNLIYPWHDSKSYPLWIDLPIVDYINGLYGIDSRHPFLDRKLFQTWINTDVEIKNKSYKHWMAEYMKLNNYPYVENEKIGLGNFAVKF